VKHFDLIKSAVSTLDREQLLDYASVCALMISVAAMSGTDFLEVSDMDIDSVDGERASEITQLVCERILEAKKSLN